jgi:hypothetical protein
VGDRRWVFGEIDERFMEEIADEQTANDLTDRRRRQTERGPKTAREVLFDLYEWAFGGPDGAGMEYRFVQLTQSVDARLHSVDSRLRWVVIILAIGVLLSNPLTAALLHPYIAAWDKMHP